MFQSLYKFYVHPATIYNSGVVRQRQSNSSTNSIYDPLCLTDYLYTQRFHFEDLETGEVFGEPMVKSTQEDLGDKDSSEIAVSLSFGPVSAAAYIAVEDTSDDDVYYTLSAEYESFSVTYGIWDLENPGNEYSHITASYAFNDNISFTVSKAMNDTPTGVEEDPLFMVSFSKTFDLK